MLDRRPLTSLVSLCLLAATLTSALAEELPLVDGVEAQPLKAQARRLMQALDFLGEPITGERKTQLEAALKETNDAAAVKAIQQALDPLALAGVNINPESRVKVEVGPAAKQLNEQGWRVFLVKVHNQAGINPPLVVDSPNAGPLYVKSNASKIPDEAVKPTDVQNRWLTIEMFNTQPLTAKLSGLELDYRIVQLYSRDRGKREATIAFNVGQGTQDIGFRNEVAILFECRPAVEVTLDVIDDDGKPTTGQFVFRDSQARVYPSRTRRLAPDFFFHDQIYRHSGEHVLLPPGEYEVTYTRGPEYRVLRRTIEVPSAAAHKETFRLKRWIQLTKHHWYSGDHHVHAAGCKHYESPTAGVGPEDMMRHILGEDLNVGCVLSWGPCWYAQKQYFGGDVHDLSRADYLMRYDVEVSGFPSAHAGHLCLLNLKEDDYAYPAPVAFDWNYEGLEGTFKGRKTELVGEWPSWDLPILKWGKEQGGVVGFSHSGFGLQVPGKELPNYNVPPYDGIGANEYIVDVAHDACDFISAVDTPSVWELNIWYHTLNCGYTCRISGETDFPCIYGDRVGLGRVYVKLDEDQPLTYEKWIGGIRDGRSYCSDGLSHLFDFRVSGSDGQSLGVGESGADGRPSVLAVKSGDKLKVRVSAAALLEEKPRDDIRNLPLTQKPFWHVERTRIGETNRLPVELIVNGVAVARQEIEADGDVNELTFDFMPERSSWVALRILPSSHTNPVFVEVDEKPIRASRRSAKWCLRSVAACWKSKVGRIREHEREAAKAAFDKAAASYRRILAESYDDTK